MTARAPGRNILTLVAYAALFLGAALAVLGALDPAAVIPVAGRPEVAAIVLVLVGLVLRSIARRRRD